MFELAQQALDRIRVKSEYFVDVRLWPLPTMFDADGWLANFAEDDLPLAALLLDSFLFISESMTDAMFISAVQSISGDIDASNRAQAVAEWSTFLNRALFCVVPGEAPNPSDSGYLFARKARQLFGLDQAQLVEPHQCLQALVRQGPIPVVFVDDFVGSGSQFTKLWHSLYPIWGKNVSFANLAAAGRGAEARYTPVVTTAEGADLIRQRCPGVDIRPAHVLDPRSSPLHPQSNVFPADVLAEGQAMIRRLSVGAGIPDTDGADEDDWQGFRKLGCALAFSHCIPDATLPIFRWDRGWRPLMRRT